MVLKVTFDTSCVVSLLELEGDTTSSEELEALKKIQALAGKGRIKLYISEKNRNEVLENLSKSTKNLSEQFIRLWTETLKILPQYAITESAWVLGVSRLGVDTVLRSEDEKTIYEDMISLCRGGKTCDVKIGDVYDYAILFEHYLNNNDLFVTRDRKNGILKHLSELFIRWGIVALEPITALDFLRGRLGESPLKKL